MLKNLLFGTLIIFAISSLGSCKKKVDELQSNAITDLITQGEWVVTQFEVGSEDKLSEYALYRFQFYKNRVVTARQNNQSDIDGSWNFTLENLTMTASFAGTPLPLSRITGIWVLTQVGLSNVAASRTEAGIEYKMALRRL